MTLDNLDSLNALGADGGKDIWLTSKDDITTNPAWLNGAVPDAAGKTNDAVPCVVIVTDHGGGKVDAFYFYFYTCVVTLHAKRESMTAVMLTFGSDTTRAIGCLALRLAATSVTGAYILSDPRMPFFRGLVTDIMD